jgi:hypothetical protein
VISGYYADSGTVFHAYTRSASGVITVINVTGAGTGFGQGTFALGINNAGVIGGYYTDSGTVAHGFVYKP